MTPAWAYAPRPMPDAPLTTAPPLPEHPMRRGALRWLLLGFSWMCLGFIAWMLLPTMPLLGGVLLAGGCGFVALALWWRRLADGVVRNNAAHDLLTRGRFDEAHALLDAIPARDLRGLVGLAVFAQRAYLHFLTGDARGGLAFADRALALPLPWVGRSNARQQRAAVRANRALMRAAVDDAAGAAADADAVEHCVEAQPVSRATAALARAVAFARADDRAALVDTLRRAQPRFVQLMGREATLARTLARLAAVPTGSAYRAPAGHAEALSEVGRWVAGVVPQGARWAPRAGAVGAAVEASRLPVATDAGMARVVASRAAAKRRARKELRWPAALWVSGMAALGGWLVTRFGGLSASLGLGAALVLSVVGLVRRHRGLDAALRAARTLTADGRDAEAEALLQPLRKKAPLAYACVALLDLAEHAERRNDPAAALALCDEALGMLEQQPNLKATLSDIHRPSLMALRARALAATGDVESALAELSLLAHEHPAFPYATGSALAVHAMVALRQGDRPLARALAASRTPDLRLPPHVATLLDLLAGEAGHFEAEGELGRIEAELSAQPGVRAWIEGLAPGLTPGSMTAPVRIADDAPTAATTGHETDAHTADAAPRRRNG